MPPSAATALSRQTQSAHFRLRLIDLCVRGSLHNRVYNMRLASRLLGIPPPTGPEPEPGPGPVPVPVRYRWWWCGGGGTVQRENNEYWAPRPSWVRGAPLLAQPELQSVLSAAWARHSPGLQYAHPPRCSRRDRRLPRPRARLGIPTPRRWVLPQMARALGRGR